MALTIEEFRASLHRTIDELTGTNQGSPPWRQIARPEQLRPEGYAHWLFLAGRGAGKTRAAAERLRERLESGKARHIALIGPTFADVRDIMVEGESGLKAVAGHLIKTYNRSNGEIFFTNGARARFFSGEDPDALRGWQSTDVWGDELCAWKYPQAAFDMAMFGLRLGEPEATWTTTPRAAPVLRALLNDPNCKTTKSTTYDNRANLSPVFFANIVKKYEGSTLGRQELEGEILEDVAGALWSRAWFAVDEFRLAPAFWVENAEDPKKRQLRFEAPPEVVRIVVALDPSASDPEKRRNPTKEPDACGLIVAGIDAIGRGYVLGDFTAILSPAQWAKLSVKLYDLAGASLIIAEANQGGEMVREVIRGYGSNVPVHLVHASLAKKPRAEPVATLYEQGRVFHCGQMADLEEQMATWDASNPGAKSPNNVDGLVWAFHGLGLCQATGLRTHDRVRDRE